MSNLPSAGINTLSSSDVLASLLQDDVVPMSTLHERYGPLLELVRVLIGVVPNCDSYLEIWPPAFRTYNILVPNFLDLPFGIFGIGNAPKSHVGLGMYVSSRAAECPYCSAHTCSYALRRGATPETVAQALVGAGEFTDKELATIAVARSLARIPCELTPAEQETLEANFPSVEAEWVVLGVVLMGFLNKFMDAISVELESTTVAETTSTLGAGWSPGKAGRDLHPADDPGTSDSTGVPVSPPESDSLWTKLSVIRYAPAALRLDKQWQKGVPNAWPAVGEFLQQLSGHDFPVLSRMQTGRGIRAVAAALRENLNPETSVIGLQTKALAGVVFATVVQDEPLCDEIRKVGLHLDVTRAQLDEAARFAGANAGGDDIPGEVCGDKTQRVTLQVARAASPSPAVIDASVVDACRDSAMSSQAIVELITWLSVLQMLHRLTSYFADSSAPIE